MSSSSSLDDPKLNLVLDTSVVINLNATGCAREIAEAFSGRLIVVDHIPNELLQGAVKGHSDAQKLQTLVEAKALRLVALSSSSHPVYESLVNGLASRTLDDGEAATIAYAKESSSAAVIDERKARALCVANFPQLPLVSTAELLTHRAIHNALGEARQTAAVLNALRGARMRVPAEHLHAVIALIGRDAASSCPSLPKKFQ